MKKILSLILLFAALRGMAQTVVQPQGAPNVRSEFRGQLIVDSIEWVVIRDTNYIPPFEGAIDFRPADRLFYTYNLGRWNLMGGGMWGKITGTITSQTDLYDTLLARQYVITNQYGIKVISGQPVFDSANVRKVDTLYRIDDTTVGFKINTIPYSFKIRGNAAGAGGIALSMPNIFTVTGSPSGFGGTLITTFNNQVANTFLGGPLTGSPGQPSFRAIAIADLPAGIPASNLAANTIGLVLGSAGLVPNVTGSPAILGSNLTLNVPNAGPGAMGFLTAADWNTFNQKVTSVNGLTGVVVQKSADSIKHLPVDTTVNRNNYVLTFDSTGHKWYLAPGTGGGGSGSVTSVGLAMPGIFNVTGSPVTTSGTLTAALANQTQNLLFASPNGSTGTPTFRALAYADLPNSVTAGSYSLTNLTVNAEGIITAISNGTGGPILSINGLNAATQVFVVGSAGTAPNIVSATATHTFNFPYASAADTGVLKSADWTTFNNKVGGIGTLNSASKSANGANVISSSLILQTVDHTFPGLMVPSDKSFLDSLHTGLLTDSIFVKNEGTTGVSLAWATGTDTLHFKKVIAGTNVNFTQNPDSSFVINAVLSGSGNTNTNIGSGYRWAVPNTNNIKTVFGGTGITIDSTTNTNALTFTNTGLVAGNNGLSISGSTVQLGGSSFIQNTTIHGAGFQYIMDSLSILRNTAYDGGHTVKGTFQLSGGGWTLQTVSNGLGGPIANFGAANSAGIATMSMSANSAGIGGTPQPIIGITTVDSSSYVQAKRIKLLLDTTLNTTGGGLFIQQNNVGGGVGLKYDNSGTRNAVLIDGTTGQLFYGPVSGGGGGGSTNSNIGSGYRLAVPSTNNIKTVFGINGILIDSSTNTNALTIQVDSSKYATLNYVTSHSATTRTFITSGTSSTLGTAANYLVTFNFASTASTYTLNLPTSPIDQEIIKIEGGGTLTTGTEVTTLTLAAGVPIYGAVVLNTFAVGEYAEYQYNSTTNAYYRHH